MFFHKKAKWWQKKKITIPLIFLALLVGIRIVLPTILLKKVNEVGREASPLYKVHAKDLDLAIIRGAGSLEGIDVFFKDNGQRFLEVKEVEVSIAWRELIKGRVLLDVEIRNFDVSVSQHLLSSLESLKKDAGEQEKKLPIKIERVVVEDSKVTFLDYPGLSGQEHLTINKINAKASNVTPQKDFPLSFFNATATFLGTTDINLVGKFNPLAEPKAWDVDFEFKKFDLRDANKILIEQIPMTFKQGTLDIYVEAESKNNKINGYVKPFMTDVKIIGKNEKFKGAKHFLIEVLGEIGNFVFEERKSESVATRVPFVYDGKFKADSTEALKKVIQHGFTQKLSHGVENLYELK